MSLMRIPSSIQSFITAWRDYPHEVNTRIDNRYLIHEIIGEGSYGITYKCTDQKNGAIVAVKQARPSKGDDAKVLLQREADMLQSLQHPQIPSYQSYFTNKHQAYLVMSYLSGDTLESLIFEKEKTYTEHNCMLMTLQLLELVIYIHEQGVAHLDLRIPNVLFRDESIYLIDFGLARRMGEPPPRLKSRHRWFWKNSLLSSSSFKTADEQSDLQDIGHFMLFVLYSAYQPDQHQKNITNLSWREELGLSDRLKEIIERLLKLKEPYASSTQLRSDLKELVKP